jgi:hypothetical protein
MMNVPPLPAPLSLEILGLRVDVDCGDPDAADLVLGNCGAMVASQGRAEVDLGYRIRRDDSAATYALTRGGDAPMACADLDDLCFAFEKDLTVELQLRRRELFFLHAAAIEWQGFVILLAAPSKSGKSTTAWALLHHGFGFLSDELAPIDLTTMSVLPFPHALCLKHEPAPPYGLPAGALRHGARIHVPTKALPGPTITAPRPLAAALLLSYRSDFDRPELRALGAAEASARLYVSALNPLAHANQGLDAVVRIAESVPCFALASAGLGATCELIRDTVTRIAEDRAKAA